MQEEKWGEIAVEIKGKVGGTEKSCESACHRDSVWRRRCDGKPWGWILTVTAKTFSFRYEVPLLFNTLCLQRLVVFHSQLRCFSSNECCGCFIWLKQRVVTVAQLADALINSLFSWKLHLYNTNQICWIFIEGSAITAWIMWMAMLSQEQEKSCIFVPHGEVKDFDARD